MPWQLATRSKADDLTVHVQNWYVIKELVPGKFEC